MSEEAETSTASKSGPGRRLKIFLRIWFLDPIRFSSLGFKIREYKIKYELSHIASGSFDEEMEKKIRLKAEEAGRLRDQYEEHLATGLQIRATNLLLKSRPEGERYYQTSPYTGRTRLNADGIEAVRSSIRKEERARREKRLALVDMLVKVATASTGLIGALIGLAAVRSC